MSDIIKSDERLSVIGTARDGNEAISQIQKLKPDVVTMDIEMPNMNGLKALEKIMSVSPLPVVMVSSLTQEGADTTLKALKLGCVDFIPKPGGAISLNMKDVSRDLVEKIVAAKYAKLPFSSDGVLRFQKSVPIMSAPKNLGSPNRIDLVAIASSTGGPVALSELLPKLPASFPVPIVITQHMPKEFTSSFASRLNETSKIEVVEGFSGLTLKPGRAVIAPGGSHLVFKRRAGKAFCELSDAPPVLFVKPAANIMFNSIAEEFGGNVLCVILTGMGRDGADGAMKLKRLGAYVIAESQKTAVVYGMPKAVVDAGVVDEILPLNEIPDALLRILNK